LFSILTHYQTYAEIEGFKHPDATAKYGFPFASDHSTSQAVRTAKTSSPLLQMLLVKFVLTLPGISSLSPEFWHVRVQGLLCKFAEADLSESYDKGAIGVRKTLATAASALIEAVARGYLGGSPRLQRGLPDADEPQEYSVPLATAWDEFIHELVYADMVDDLCERLIESDDVEGHSPTVQAAADYTIVQFVVLSCPTAG
jgi:hypothetical protein